MGKTLQDKLGDFASSTTIHGIQDLVTAGSRCLKAIWGLVMAASMGMLIYQMGHLFYQYSHCPTSFQSSIIPQHSFPPIRIYAQNFINITKPISPSEVTFRMGHFYGWQFDCYSRAVGDFHGSNYNLLHLMNKYYDKDKAGDVPKTQCTTNNNFLPGIPSLSSVEPLLPKSVLGLGGIGPSTSVAPNTSGSENDDITSDQAQHWRDQINSYSNKPFDLQAYFNSIRYQDKDLVALSSTQDGDHPSVSKADITPILDDFGLSYRVDVEISNETSQEDAMGQDASVSFHIKLRALAPTYVRHMELSKPQPGLVPISVGCIVAFGTDLVDQVRWFVPKPNTDYTVVMNPTVRKLINSKRNPCNKHDKTSLKGCVYKCEMEAVECNYDCAFYPKSPEKGKYLCNQFLVNLAKPPVKEICNTTVQKCKEACRMPCEIWEYSTQVIEGFNSFYTTEFSTMSWNPLDLPMSFFRVSLNQGWRASVVEEYYVYSAASLMSNVGGLFGLFVGGSVISLGHIIFFWCCKARIKGKEEDREL